ncbi:MAG TPA: helix-turn-helix domain-containing protein [Gammaproteobacteria bacterium]|nr:helix-turn-helix domain-containing protein [Gammaproteobacteria bacterium]
MQKTAPSVTNTELLKELQDIKRILVVALIKSGASQGEVATALNVNQSSISRMFPSKDKSKKKSG